MDTNPKVTPPRGPINARPSSAQRRAAEAASLSNKQAQLKQEAAERRAQRDSQTPSTPRQAARKTRNDSL